MIWDEEIESELAGLGQVAHYVTGAWLPDCIDEQPIIRHILSGHIDVHTSQLPRSDSISRYGPGEILGIRSNTQAQNQQKTRCRAVSDIECREIPWNTLDALSKENPRLAMLMQHIAQMRAYDTAIATHPAFSCLHLDERRKLFQHAIVRLLAPRETLIRQQGGRAHLYLVISGSVEIVADGVRIVQRGKGELLGEISLFGFSNQPTADVIAEKFTEILEFTDADMLAAMNTNPAFRQRITALAGNKLR